MSIVALVLVGVFAAVALADIPPVPPPQWFTQNVDHFDFRNNATFQQRVLVYDDNYRPGGAVFFYCGAGGC